MQKVILTVASTVTMLSAHCSQLHTAVEQSGNAVYGWSAGIMMAALAILAVRLHSEGEKDV